VSDAADSHYYGYGVWLQKDRENWILSVKGSDPGVSMVSRVWLKHDLIVTVLSNVQNGACAVSRQLDEKLNAI
jgi:hypothetical protein